MLNDGHARQLLSGERLHTPHLIDAEVASGLRRHFQSNKVSSTDGWNALNAWRHVAVTRYPVYGLLERIWSLRQDVSSYDASYVALAESLDCVLVTADGRLSNAAHVRCTITVAPR